MLIVMLLSVLLGAEPVFFLEHLGKSQLIGVSHFAGFPSISFPVLIIRLVRGFLPW
jgi:hypothetical protein